MMPGPVLDEDALLAYDREHLWHPYTSMTVPTPVRLVTGASGCELQLGDGSRVVDGMSSWWAAIHGYRHPVLDAALAAQAGEFAHVMFGGITHAPAIRLAERLVDITPDGLDHVFLADSGSVSVEVAIKMVLQHQRGIGRPERTRLLTVRGGYHGDTFGCMSVCDPVGGMHSMFTEVLPQHVFADQPPALVEEVVSRRSRERPPRPKALATVTRPDVDTWADHVRNLAESNARELAGIIVEPLLQGAGGMHAYPAECLRVLREVADEHGLVLVFDEIATGFGRTGTLFAADAAGVTPDVMCLGKALTGGYLTLAAVLCTGEIGRGLSASESGVLMHGPTYMGNPLACAVALASIDLLLAGDWQDRVRHINHRLTTGLAPLRGVPGVADVRTIGAVGVVQLDHPVDVVAATDAAMAAGVWLRPFRDLIYTMPPYVISDGELDRLLGGIAEAVKAG
jgi:adenosylmethionine---8-amino-7-oxononanoate aminotransferase